MRFLNASVLERKALNRNLSLGFPLGSLLPKTRVLKHRVLERKRRPNANASVLGTQRFRTLRVCEMSLQGSSLILQGCLLHRKITFHKGLTRLFGDLQIHRAACMTMMP